MKRFFVFVLTLAACAFCFAGCGKKEEFANPGDTRPNFGMPPGGR